MQAATAVASMSPSGLSVTWRMNLPVPSIRRAGSAILGAVEEADIDVRREGVDIRKCCVPDARSRVAIVQHLSHVVSALAHHLEPALRNRTQCA